MCCTWLAGNIYRTQKWPKKSPSAHHRTICRAISSQLRHISTTGKNLLNSNISPTCPQTMVNFGPLTAEIYSGVWGTPANFNGFRVLPSLLQRRRSPEANETLHDVLPSPRLVNYIYFFGGSSADGILPSVKFTLRPTLAFSYIGSVTAWHSSSVREPSFAAWYKEWNYGTLAEAAPIFGRAAITLGIGPHSSYY